MKIIKCDFCGAEIEDGGKQNIIPMDNGWTVLEGSELATRWSKDVCPRCVPEKVMTNRDVIKSFD